MYYNRDTLSNQDAFRGPKRVHIGAHCTFNFIFQLFFFWSVVINLNPRPNFIQCSSGR